MKSGFFWIFLFFAKNVLLIKVYFLYNRCVNFRVPSKIFLLKLKLEPTFRDILLVQTCRNVKSAILTRSAETKIWALKFLRIYPKMRNFWLTMTYATLLLLKFFNFISKKCHPEARFGWFCISRRLKTALFHSKLKIFRLKMVSDLLYVTR